MNITRLLTTGALIASVTVSGAVLADDTGNHGKADGWRKQHAELMAQLPPEKATLLKETMKKAREDNKGLEDKIHKLHDDERTLLTADKFDKVAFLAKSAEVEKTQAEIHTHMQEAFASVAGQFSPDERKILAKLRRDQMPRGDRMNNGGKESENPQRSK